MHHTMLHTVIGTVFLSLKKCNLEHTEQVYSKRMFQKTTTKLPLFVEVSALTGRVIVFLEKFRNWDNTDNNFFAGFHKKLFSGSNVKYSFSWHVLLDSSWNVLPFFFSFFLF